MNFKFQLLISLLLISSFSFGQRRKSKNQPSATVITYEDSLYNGLKWRNIGPFRGGRSTTSTGVLSDPLTYYFGSAGGGVWKTQDAGLSWKNISDKFFKTTSIGAIAVAESDENVIYVGTGEAAVRGVMTTHGDGVYKSTDAGQTWSHVGLENSRHISAIRIHPDNPDVVYVAAQGSAYAASKDKGVYKSIDGGKTWRQVHFVDENSGVSDLSMDMNNPRILYAAFWDNRRMPWFVRSGGPGSGIWKSMDSGETWEKLSEGLPKTVMGKIGISVSRANSNRVYAIIESEEGGLYRSDDKGKKWQLLNKQRVLRARSWYYMHIKAHPTNENIVYVLNAPVNKSIDGGKTFSQVPTPHGDNHDIWINPLQPQYMINSNDGGANVSLNGGKSWSSQQNQPTAQFYRITVDNRFPYWIYAGQQDNSTVAIPSRTDGAGIGWKNWRAGVGGGESAHIGLDPNDPKYIYATTITGFIDEYNWETEKLKAIKPYPIFDLGEPSDEMRYRYNWNPPVTVSQHNPKTIYFGSNVLHKSTNRGITWTDISPDLTKNDTAKLGLMGGPITNEAAGGEIYHTIMTITESLHDANTIWIGADDGSVQISRDGGKNWQNVSPGPEGIINSIEVSPHDPGTAYITVMRYKFDDLKPYIYKTNNYGQSWQNMTRGIPKEVYARVVREDPNQKGLLYAGTERGVYISFDNGASWKAFQQNLPMTPITDLKVHQNDLIAATHGRAFWILDDLTPIHQLAAAKANDNVFLYQPRDVIKTGSYGAPEVTTIGQNPFPGASIHYYLKDIPKEDSTELVMEIYDQGKNMIRRFSSEEKSPFSKIEKKKGMNTLKWDLAITSLKPTKGVLLPPGITEIAGYHVMPGNYVAKLTYGDFVDEQSFRILPDPRDQVSEQDRNNKKEMLTKVYVEIEELYESLRGLQQVRDQISNITERLEDEEVTKSGEEIKNKIQEVESDLISPKQETFQDIINFRNQLDRQLYNLLQTVDSNVPPLTSGEQELYDKLHGEWQQLSEQVNQILNENIGEFNKMLKEKGVEYVAPKKVKPKENENVQ